MSSELPDGWAPRTLSSLAHYQNGRAFKPAEWSEEGLPIVRIAQLTDQRAEPKFYNGGDVKAVHLIDDDDLIFSWSATLLVHIWKRGPAVLNQHLFKVTEREDVDRLFLAYRLSASVDSLARQAHGTTMKHIKKGELDATVVGLPPLPEQRKIAEILSSVDEAIRATEAVIEQTEKVKQATLKQLLTKGIGHTRFKQTEIGWIPESWEATPLGSVLSAIDSGWSPNCDKDTALEDEWAVLRTSAVTWNGFDPNENKRLPTDLKPRPNLQVKVGDILITRAGPKDRTGVVAFVDHAPPKRMLSDKLIRLTTKTDLIRPYFMSLVLSQPFAQLQLMKKTSGMAESQTNISQKIVRETVVIVPPLAEQEEIERCMKRFNGVVTDNAAILGRLRRTKNAMAAHLLSGRKRVAA